MHTLIVGGDGGIGHTLAVQLRLSGNAVFSTSRQADSNYSTETLYLDLSDKHCVKNFEIPDVENCVIFSAITSIKECEENYEQAYQINVTNTIALIKRLQENKVFTVFPSSDQVFPADSVSNTVYTATKPANKYGQMKAEVEEFISGTCRNACVIRLGKVIGSQFPLIESFIKQLSENRQIAAYSNYYLAPISSTLCCEVITRLLSKKLPDLYQLSATEAINYHQLVKILAKQLGLDELLINESLKREEGIVCPKNHPIMSSFLGFVANASDLDLSIESSLIDIVPSLKSMLED